MRPRICRPFSRSTRARMEPPSLTRNPRGPFGVMAVEGILDQFCISRRPYGRLRKFGTRRWLQPELHFPFRLAGLRRICEKSYESLGWKCGGRQCLPAEDLGWLGDARCGGAEAVLRAGTACVF